MQRALICAVLSFGVAATSAAAQTEAANNTLPAAPIATAAEAMAAPVAPTTAAPVVAEPAPVDAEVQTAAEEVSAPLASLAKPVRFEPVRGAVRVDSTNVPFEVQIQPSALAPDSSSIEAGGDHWEARGYDLKSLVAQIFDLDARLVDLPDRLAGDARFDISFSAPVELDQESVQHALVDALTQRLGVTIQPEPRTMDVYVLSAPAGPASGLKPHRFARRTGGAAHLFGDDDSMEAGGRITYSGKNCSGVNSGGITVEGSTLADFRRTLEPDLDRVLLDETKLDGSYDFRIGFYANQSQLFEVMRAQLGLVVTPQQRKVTVLTVRVAQPNGQTVATLKSSPTDLKGL